LGLFTIAGALSGRRELVVNFGDERLIIGQADPADSYLWTSCHWPLNG